MGKLAESLPGPRGLVEVFVLLNIAFLGPDVLLAHSVTGFPSWTHWIPIGFSAGGTLLLASAWLCEAKLRLRSLGRVLGLVVGCSSVAVAFAGLIFHMRDGFFVEQTLRNLVYTAPFAAPLAFGGLGMLLILNRTRVESGWEWSRWVVLLALGGFVGNFALSLADHAQNGFFVWQEWIPVVSAALAIGALVLVVAFRVDRDYLRLCAGVMGLQVAIGLLGVVYHVSATLHGSSKSLLDNLVYGAPVFAPLLFADLALLAGIGLWSLGSQLEEPAAAVVLSADPLPKKDP